MSKFSKINSKDLLKPVNMLNLYAQGAFPMADEKNEISWYQPKERCIILMENFNIPRSLQKFMSTSDFEFRFDENISDVIKNCANRETTWISEELISAYLNLAKLGYLHSVEVYQKNILVGGLYGIAIGGVFFGESMFSKVSQASKSALSILITHLKKKNFIFLDVQFPTPHLKMFGTKEIDFEEYNGLLEIAYLKEVSFL
ncbi:MAG: leucyl/phenylalanyl-tRNA--protein transferase [Ignavibacteriae bacterium]|nr:leucyl/phenylalanyl-tRNA--protein transferase [Ignavibacteriota bacterium]